MNGSDLPLLARPTEEVLPYNDTEMHSLSILADVIWVPVLQSTRLHTPDPVSVSKQDQGCGSTTVPSAQPSMHSKQEAPRSTPGISYWL